MRLFKLIYGSTILNRKPYPDGRNFMLRQFIRMKMIFIYSSIFVVITIGHTISQAVTSDSTCFPPCHEGFNCKNNQCLEIKSDTIQSDTIANVNINTVESITDLTALISALQRITIYFTLEALKYSHSINGADEYNKAMSGIKDSVTNIVVSPDKIKSSFDTFFSYFTDSSSHLSFYIANYNTLNKIPYNIRSLYLGANGRDAMDIFLQRVEAYNSLRKQVGNITDRYILKQALQNFQTLILEMPKDGRSGGEIGNRKQRQIDTLKDQLLKTPVTLYSITNNVDSLKKYIELRAGKEETVAQTSASYWATMSTACKARRFLRGKGVVEKSSQNNTNGLYQTNKNKGIYSGNSYTVRTGLDFVFYEKGPLLGTKYPENTKIGKGGKGTEIDLRKGYGINETFQPFVGLSTWVFDERPNSSDTLRYGAANADNDDQIGPLMLTLGLTAMPFGNSYKK
jgi:hypothetical protein